MENIDKQIKPFSVRSDGVSDETLPKTPPDTKEAERRAKIRAQRIRNLNPVTKGSKEAKELSKKGNMSKRKLAEMRAAIRAEILRQCTPELLAKRTVDAIKQGNLELATVLEKCSKMVGTHFEQTEEYVQHFESKSKTEGTTSVKLVIEDMAKPVEG
jgi:hypothetical protein